MQDQQSSVTSVKHIESMQRPLTRFITSNDSSYMELKHVLAPEAVQEIHLRLVVPIHVFVDKIGDFYVFMF